MSKNTRRRQRRQGIRQVSAAEKKRQVDRRNRRDFENFVKSDTELVTVKAIDVWADIADSLYSVPGRPFRMKRSPYAKKFTVVLAEPLPVLLVKELIQSILEEEVKSCLDGQN